MPTLRYLLALGLGAALNFSWTQHAAAEPRETLVPKVAPALDHRFAKQIGRQNLALARQNSTLLPPATKRPTATLAQSTGAAGDPPPRSPTSAAADLVPLNPDPDLLNLPTTPAAVNIDLNQPITLQQALELARRNNRDLQVAELQLRQNQAALREARAALYPTVGLQASVVRSDSASSRIAIRGQRNQLSQQQQQVGLQLQGLTQQQQAIQNQLQQSLPAEQRQQLQQQLLGVQTQQQGLTQQQQALAQQSFSSVSNTFNGNVQLGYNAYTSGQRSASIQAAEEAVRAAEVSVETQLEQLRLDVANDYYDIQQADELVRIAQSAVENALISLRDTEALERAGLGTRFDVLRAQVQLANAQQQLTQALSQQRISRRQLAQRLSLAESATILAADPVAIAGQWNFSLAETIVQALQNRGELAQLLSRRNIAQLNRRFELASLGPQVSAFANLSAADQLDDSQLGALGYSIGGQVDKVIFDGGAARARAAQQEANVKIAETQFANFKNLIRFQVEQNYFTLNSSFENIQTNSIAVEQARESLRLARLRFQAGVGTQLEVSNAETDLTRAQSNLLQAILDYNRALASLQRFVSNLPNRPTSSVP